MLKSMKSGLSLTRKSIVLMDVDILVLLLITEYLIEDLIFCLNTIFLSINGHKYQPELKCAKFLHLIG